MKKMKEEFFLCQCFSSEHQFIFHYDEETNEIYVSVHLITHDNIFKRIWSAIKYVFGHTSKYGDWDEFIFNYGDSERLKEIIGKLKDPEEHIKKVNERKNCCNGSAENCKCNKKGNKDD